MPCLPFSYSVLCIILLICSFHGNYWDYSFNDPTFLFIYFSFIFLSRNLLPSSCRDLRATQPLHHILALLYRHQCILECHLMVRPYLMAHLCHHMMFPFLQVQGTPTTMGIALGLEAFTDHQHSRHLPHSQVGLWWVLLHDLKNMGIPWVSYITFIKIPLCTMLMLFFCCSFVLHWVSGAPLSLRIFATFQVVCIQSWTATEWVCHWHPLVWYVYLMPTYLGYFSCSLCKNLHILTNCMFSCLNYYAFTQVMQLIHIDVIHFVFQCSLIWWTSLTIGA